MKVAVIEDEIRIREGIVKLLHRFYPNIEDIYESDSGVGGLEIVRERHPDIVITDIRMSPLNGLDMLQILLQEEKRQFKTIILSAYSEFDYAKRAISLGVSEYLVKPVEVGEFRRVMQRVEDELREETMAKMGNPQALRSLATIFRGLLSGQLQMDAELESFLPVTYGLQIHKPLALVALYFGKRYREESQQVANKIQAALLHAGYQDQQIVFFPDDRRIVVVLYNIDNPMPLERVLQVRIMREIREMTGVTGVLGFASCGSPNDLRATLEALVQHLPWSISLGKDVLISYPKITQVQAGMLQYPVQIEKDCVAALCRVDYDALNAGAVSLLQSVTQKLYAPEAIKKCLARYILSMLQVVKEINYTAYEHVDEPGLMEEIAGAVTITELETTLFQLLESVSQKTGQAVGPLVQKAQQIVEECYRQGITLEEIAERLHMTPDHISAQFARELGMNFSTYMKQYRMNKAKELLIGTDLKLYEIAEQVGYNDAKYFSRVFKETMGALPAEYRKSHRP